MVFQKKQTSHNYNFIISQTGNSVHMYLKQLLSMLRAMTYCRIRSKRGNIIFCSISSWFMTFFLRQSSLFILVKFSAPNYCL